MAEEAEEAGPARGSRGPVLAVVASAAGAFAAYSALALLVDAPRVFTDELLYFDTAASIVDGDGLTIRGEAYRYAPLYPALLATVHWIAADREAAYELAKTLNALLIALTAIPVFLVSRRVLSPWPSVATAVFSVAIPSAMYVSVVMTESLAYLVCWWALYAIVLALERPSALRQVAAMGGILLATGVRTQFLALFGIYLLGLVFVPALVEGRRPRTRSAILSFWPTALAIAAAVVALVSSWILGSSDRTLGEYAVLVRTYDVLEVAGWSLYQVANIEMYVAVIPFAVAPIVIWAFVGRTRQGSERHAAFLAVFVSVNVVFLLLTAAFNSTVYADDALHDRPVFYVVPLWLIVLFAWTAEGAPRPWVVAGVGAAVALTLPLAIPFSDYARDDARQQFNAVTTTLWASIDRASDGSGRPVLLVFVLLLVLGAVLLPARYARLLPVVVLAVFALTSRLSWDLAVRVAAPSTAALRSDERSWIDENVPRGRTVTVLGGVESCPRLPERDRLYGREFLSAYLTEFFNSSVRRGAYVGLRRDSLPAERVRVEEGGRLLLGSGAPLVADYLLAQPAVRFEGRKVVTGTAAGLNLWEIGGAVRALGIHSTAEYKRAACIRLRPA